MGVMNNLCTPKSGEILIAATQARLIGDGGCGVLTASCPANLAPACAVVVGSQHPLLLYPAVPVLPDAAAPRELAASAACPTCSPSTHPRSHPLAPVATPSSAGLPDLRLPADQQGPLPDAPRDFADGGLHDRWVQVVGGCRWQAIGWDGCR